MTGSWDAQRGLTVVELLLAGSLLVVAFGLLGGLMLAAFDSELQHGQSFQLRTKAQQALREITRELEVTTTEGPDYQAEDEAITYNLPQSLGPTIVWTPAVRCYVNDDGELVREQSGTSRVLMAEVASLAVTSEDSGRRVTLTLTVQGRGSPAPVLVEERTAILLH